MDKFLPAKVSPAGNPSVGQREFLLLMEKLPQIGIMQIRDELLTFITIAFVHSGVTHFIDDKLRSGIALLTVDAVFFDVNQPIDHSFPNYSC